ncbi:hypothetical protein [Actinophytocola sp.]|uniref:hypothetical protein n=1 Tax=Actinophytocola sp. TaxID=1872138 RepID=UPI002D46C8CD|nr:hypothetical protein [Actinophytocola sp.]HYQ65744.1 hypothetical protein [Actinophytocola sp.]
MDLHTAAERGTAGQVAALAAEAPDVDGLAWGRTPLWRAVFENKPDNARALVAAGADPYREMMAGWSPARLAAAGPTPDLFGPPAELSSAETEMVAEARRLAAALGSVVEEGIGLACVAGIDVAEATRRLAGTSCAEEDTLDVVGVTGVPGGVVVMQPYGYRPQDTDVHERLSAGTVCYGLYENPKSGSQGSVSRDGELLEGDLVPGGDPADDDSAREVLLAYLHRDDSVAYACAYPGLRLTDARAVVGPPDVWLRLPDVHETATRDV